MITAEISKEHYKTEIDLGAHKLIVDEPRSIGGTDLGPDPSSLFLASVGACVAITLRMYADRKEWDLEGVKVELSLERGDDETVIKRRLITKGNLDEKQLKRLQAIAGKCPVSKMVTGNVRIESMD